MLIAMEGPKLRILKVLLLVLSIKLSQNSAVMQEAELQLDKCWIGLKKGLTLWLATYLFLYILFLKILYLLFANSKKCLWPLYEL